MRHFLAQNVPVRDPCPCYLRFRFTPKRTGINSNSSGYGGTGLKIHAGTILSVSAVHSAESTMAIVTGVHSRVKCETCGDRQTWWQCCGSGCGCDCGCGYCSRTLSLLPGAATHWWSRGVCVFGCCSPFCCKLCGVGGWLCQLLKQPDCICWSRVAGEALTPDPSDAAYQQQQSFPTLCRGLQR